MARRQSASDRRDRGRRRQRHPDSTGGSVALSGRRGSMTVPFYPLLLAVYPILALLASNIDQVHTGSALRPALLSAASALLLMGGLRLRLRDWHRAAAPAGPGALAFFTYGHVYDVLKNVE